jgi:hypothetical protein
VAGLFTLCMRSTGLCTDLHPVGFKADLPLFLQRWLIL